MSLPDRFQPGSRAGRLLLSVCVLGMALIAGGCQVMPRYSTPSPTVTGSVNDNIRSKLASISINQPGDRVTQEVRNNLIFLFGGGAGEPTSPVYSLQLGISSRDLSLLLVQNATNDKSGQPTAGSMRMTGNYTLTRLSDGKVVGNGTRIVTADYDAPRQRYAVLRAQRDANIRAAREVAEAINLSIAQDLSKL
jgi:LPS-assembly lipoprotein